MAKTLDMEPMCASGSNNGSTVESEVSIVISYGMQTRDYKSVREMSIVDTGKRRKTT